jgi:hypothetical protein
MDLGNDALAPLVLIVLLLALDLASLLWGVDSRRLEPRG